MFTDTEKEIKKMDTASAKTDGILKNNGIRTDVNFMFKTAINLSCITNDFLAPETKKQRRNKKIVDTAKIALFTVVANTIISRNIKVGLYAAGVVISASSIFGFRSDKHYRNKNAKVFYKTFSKGNRQRFLQDSFKNNDKARDFFVQATEMCRDAMKQGKTIDSEFVASAKETIVNKVYVRTVNTQPTPAVAL